LIRRGAASFGFSIEPAARQRLPRIVAAALAMGGLLWTAVAFAPTLVENPHNFAQAAILGLLIVGAVATYGLVLSLFGAVNWADAASALRPSPPRDLRA
jgi:putative peptidoglycan lipid II flippase